MKLHERKTIKIFKFVYIQFVVENALKKNLCLLLINPSEADFIIVRFIPQTLNNKDRIPDRKSKSSIVASGH